MHELLSRLRAGEILVADGAMGSLLFESALRPGECPEALNLSYPELLEEIARRYLEAGAQIVQTNTFGGTPLRLSLHDLEAQTEEINRNAVAAVRRAVGDRAYVSGSCGPCGRTLKPYGDTEPGEVRAAFVRQMKTLIEAGVDILCIETMTDLSEAVIAIQAAKEAGGDIPVIATMTFDATPRGFYTIMGVDVRAAASGLAAAGADVVGSNCGNGIERMVEIAREFRQHTRLPLIIQSNAGLPRMEADRPVYDETPEFMAEKAADLVAAGVAIIGGCCGTTPEHIRALSAALSGSRQPESQR
jgi:5-methyltetrahydrofolate--homocysteine methyltransferase